MKAIRRSSPSAGPGSPDVTGFYEPETGSVQYLVSDPSTSKAALIDVVRDFDPRAAATATRSAEAILEEAGSQGLAIEWVLDTHPHADHLMASAWLRDRTGAPNGIGAEVREIAGLWRDFYNMPDAFDPDAAFDRLFEDGDAFKIGSLPVRVMLSPGHTLGSITYVVGDDAAFVHDTFMQPDAGTSRADFPGGSAATLYDSLQALLALPDRTRLFVGHDYGTEDRPDPAWEATVAKQRADNIHLGGGTSRDAYVRLREARDATLALPDRMLHVIQMNLRAGRPPEPEEDGRAYLKIPLDRFAETPDED
jgi:glyoxylase-like metal-dependent hydrolase (beta-lactamase superfamily II)